MHRVGCCYVARLHVSLVSHHTSLPLQAAASEPQRRARSAARRDARHDAMRRDASRHFVIYGSTNFESPHLPALMAFGVAVKTCNDGEPRDRLKLLRLFSSLFLSPSPAWFRSFFFHRVARARTLFASVIAGVSFRELTFPSSFNETL